MRRTVGMLGLTLLVAGLLAVPAPAGQLAGPSSVLRAAPAEGAPFTLGGRPCTLIAVPSAEESPPVGIGACPGVRPGGLLKTDIGLCTFNFLYRTPDGQRFIGTAGHCILGSSPVSDNAGERVWPAGQGPVAQGTDGKRIGEFAYAVLQDPKDFALIRLDPGVEASAEMCHFGGPVGVNDQLSSDVTFLQYYGNGIAIGQTVPARSGVAFGLPNPDHVYATGVAVPGDSGSGVIDSEGRAVGVLVTTGLHGFGIDENGLDVGTMGITRLGPQLGRAQEALAVQLELQTAPLK